MKVSSFAVARPNYYDRNSAAIISTYAAQNAPHASTIRITRTIAAGRKDYCEFVNLTIIRSSVATILGRQFIYFTVTPSGGSANNIVTVVQGSNTSQIKEQITVPSGITFYPGDVMSIATEDGSTGGDGLYYLAYRATGFDS